MYVIPIHPSEFLQDVLLVLPAHLLLVVALLHSPVYLALDFLLHVRGHISVVLQLAHTVHVVLLLVKLEGIEAMLFLLLVIDIGSRLLFL